MTFLAWIIAVVLAVIGVVELLQGAVLWAIVLFILAAIVGPGGYSILNRA
ncbi:MAG TPA: GPGG-motif small membrane protein [Acidimicrobiales bacterium]|nr:GPGG-motif small membrane protein [Acidimicrobiales bacterium]